MSLTLPEIKAAKPQAKDLWLSDEKGLRLLVKPSGARYWRMKYRFRGKQKTLALGVYPDVSLTEARLARDRARIQIADGIDPASERVAEKLSEQISGDNRFSVLAALWWEHQKGTWTENHAERVWKRLRDDTFDALDQIPVQKIQTQDIIAVIKKVEDRDALDVASRVLQDVRRVFRYAVQHNKLAYNPASELDGVLKPRLRQHRASLPLDQLGGFIVALEAYPERGRLLTQLALKLLMLTFVRPGEIHGACWSEFDWEKRLWRIPAERMKMRIEHLVPLSSQALAVLEQIREVNGQYDLLFPSERDRDRPMSDGTMRLAMFRMGYDGKTHGKARATPHGFRANASSILNEQGFNPDAVERQLSHMEGNNVRAAYIHHARYLEERTGMMQWWADHLDELALEARQSTKASLGL